MDVPVVPTGTVSNYGKLDMQSAFVTEGFELVNYPARICPMSAWVHGPHKSIKISIVLKSTERHDNTFIKEYGRLKNEIISIFQSNHGSE